MIKHILYMCIRWFIA